MSELFPCPFCGGEAEVYEMQYGATSWITPIGYDRPIVHHHHGTPNYCPNCGAKVVGE